MASETTRLGRSPAAQRSAPRLRLPPWLLVLLSAALLATGCADDGDSTARTGSSATNAAVNQGPDIRDITSDPGDFVGDEVKLRGTVDEIFHLEGGFLLEEADGGGDDLIVYDLMLPLGITEGDEVEVRGTVRLVDDEFREAVDDQFFDDLAFKDIEGQAAIDATSITDASVAAGTIASDFDTFDANGDSYLDADEIAESADATGFFEVWDADADSELDRDEIAGNAFRLWDRDGSNTVSEEEWRTGTELWYPTKSKLVVFDDVDDDGDSELDADEFAERFDLSALGEAWQPQTYTKDTFKRAYFELYDTDDDGQVSEDEWAYGGSAFGTPAE